MKKLSNLALALMGFAATMTSCSSEDFNVTGGTGEVVSVTLTAQLPANIQSRAFADGTSATNLYYAVYAEGETTPLLIKDANSTEQITFDAATLTAKASIDLVSGKEYDIVFFAANPAAPYTFDAATQSVSVDYANMKLNDDKNDAFFGTVKSFQAGVDTPDNPIKLYRPFSQINVGTSDLEVAQKSGLGTLTAKMKVTGVYTSFNLMDGTVTGATDVDFDVAAIPTGEAFPLAGYDYLEMAYVLVDDQITTNATLEFYGNGSLYNSIDVPSVPLQRNFRTNIIGKLLTSSVDFEILIVPDFNLPDNLVGVQVKNAAELTAAIAKAKTEGGIITLTEDIAVSGQLLFNTDQPVVLDLGDNNLTVTDNYILVNDGASVAITNGTISANPSANNATFISNNPGSTIVLNNVTVNDTTKFGLVAQYGGTIEISNSTINSTGGNQAVQIGSGSKMTLKNTTVNHDGAKHGIVVLGDLDMDGGAVNMSGAGKTGTIVAVNASGSANVALKDVDLNVDNIYAAIVPNQNTTLTVTGGEINGENIQNGIDVAYSADVTITGTEINMTATGDFNKVVTGVALNMHTTDGSDSPHLTMKDVVIKAKDYAVGSNASIPGHPVIDMDNCKLYATVAFMNNVETIDGIIKNCLLEGNSHGAFVRGGNITFTNTSITLNTSVYASEAAAQAEANANLTDWGTGASVTRAALTFGNLKVGAYNYPTTVVLNKCEVAVTGTYADLFYTVCGEMANGKAVSCTYDAATTFTGGKGNKIGAGVVFAQN